MFLYAFYAGAKAQREPEPQLKADLPSFLSLRPLFYLRRSFRTWTSTCLQVERKPGPPRKRGVPRAARRHRLPLERRWLRGERGTPPERKRGERTFAGGSYGFWEGSEGGETHTHTDSLLIFVFRSVNCGPLAIFFVVFVVVGW